MAIWGETRTDTTTVRPPFRILPARPRDLTLRTVIILIGLCLLGFGVWAFDMTEQTCDKVAFACIVLGTVFAPFGLLSFVREWRNFNPRNEYAFIIGVGSFAFVTPSRRWECAWKDLDPFEVREMREGNKYHPGVTYQLIVHGEGHELRIPYEDFGTTLGAKPEERARALCRILDELRHNALHGSEDARFEVPAGLIVGPLKSKSALAGFKVRSVIQRQ